MKAWKRGHGQRASEPERPRVLVVEDDEELNDLLVWYLVDGGCEVASAKNGSEALAYLGNSSFDVVVTDLAMPDMDGLEMLRQIRGAGAGLQLIVTSGHMDDAAAEELLELTVFQCFEKPFGLREVLTAVREAVGIPEGKEPEAVPAGG